MISEDRLWKGIIDNFAAEAISLIFPEAQKTLDLNRKPEFLETELRQIYTVDGIKPITKIADKLIKVYTHQGDNNYVLIHVEVQAKYDPVMGRRLLTSYYRIDEMFHKPLTTLVIYTENILKKRTDNFVLDFLGTSLDYKFNAYQVTAQEHNELANHSNPFAIVMATAKMKAETKRIKNLILRDLRALETKIELIKQLIARKLDPEKQQMLFIFICAYIHLENEDNKVKFDRELVKLLKTEKSMGIIETVLIETKRESKREGKLEGKREGKLEGKREGILEGRLATAIEMKKDGMPIEQIMKFTKLSIYEIEQAIA